MSTANACEPYAPDLRIRRLGVRVPSGAQHHQACGLRKRRSRSVQDSSTVDLWCSYGARQFRTGSVRTSAAESGQALRVPKTLSVQVTQHVRLAEAKVDPGCCQLPVVSARRSRLEWGIWTLVRGGGSPGMLTWRRANGSAPVS
jgi:hypothetical protein